MTVNSCDLNKLTRISNQIRHNCSHFLMVAQDKTFRRSGDIDDKLQTTPFGFPLIHLGGIRNTLPQIKRIIESGLVPAFDPRKVQQIVDGEEKTLRCHMRSTEIFPRFGVQLAIQCKFKVIDDMIQRCTHCKATLVVEHREWTILLTYLHEMHCSEEWTSFDWCAWLILFVSRPARDQGSMSRLWNPLV